MATKHSVARPKDDVFFTKRKSAVQVDGQHKKPELNASQAEDLLEVVDFDDVDETTTTAEKSSSQGIARMRATFANSGNGNAHIRAIDYDTAITLKTLLIGEATKTIGSEWSKQYFEFEFRSSSLWYGLVQHKGGPCGVLASLQAFLCVQYFHSAETSDSIEPSKLSQYRWRCLSQAICDILWQIGGNKQTAVLVFEDKEALLKTNARFHPDGITEHLVVAEFFSRAQLFQFISNLFEQNLLALGCVSLAYSCILSRGMDEICQDYDTNSTKTLLTTNGLLCTQELVNLMLIGRAVSNVFDRNVRYNDVLLRGITHQSSIGFLTLHEFHQDINVGACYKNPKYPIFVVLSEAHFTVLFRKETAISKSKDGNQCFDIFYYDGLLRPENEVRLTIELVNAIEYDKRLNSKAGSKSTTNSVPIECVIRTKWPNARVNWNQSDKIF